ncbi:MAG: Hsp20/alpha crystallin family protein [Bacteroidota bacterium]
MRLENKIPQEILQSIDFFNTVNGGTSPINTNIKKTKENYRITVKVPGVNPDDFNVEVRNNFISVFQSIGIHQERVSLPRLIASFQIPMDADYKSISAFDRNGVLTILIPFNELESGYSQSIEIFKD